MSGSSEPICVGSGRWWAVLAFTNEQIILYLDPISPRPSHLAGRCVSVWTQAWEGMPQFWSRHGGLLALCRLGDNYRQIGKAHAALFLPCVDVFRVPAKKTIRGHFQFESNNTHYLLTNSRPLTSHNPRPASHLQTYTHTHTHHHQEQPPLPTAVR